MSERPEPVSQLADQPINNGINNRSYKANKVLFLLLLNLALSIFWPVLISSFTMIDFAIGFVGGLLLISIAEASYGLTALHLAEFVAYLGWQIVQSNFRVARLSLGRQKPRSCIVDVPLSATTEFEIVTLASVITLTPGTLSVDLGRDPEDRHVLYVHCLQMEDIDGFRREIKEGFERRIMDITRRLDA